FAKMKLGTDIAPYCWRRFDPPIRSQTFRRGLTGYNFQPIGEPPLSGWNSPDKDKTANASQPFRSISRSFLEHEEPRERRLEAILFVLIILTTTWPLVVLFQTLSRGISGSY